jgi:hypothetical protein
MWQDKVGDSVSLSPLAQLVSNLGLALVWGPVEQDSYCHLMKAKIKEPVYIV